MRIILIVLALIVYNSCTKVVTEEYIPEVASYSGVNIDDWSMLEDVNCEWLILTGSNITASDLGYLRSVKGLTKLSIDDCDSIEYFDSLIWLDIEWLDVDSCDGIDSFPFQDMKKLKHLEAGYCWEVEKNNYEAFQFVKELNLEYLSIGMMGYCADTSNHLPLIDTLVGGSVNDSAYYKENGVIYINESKQADKWYKAHKG